MNKAREAFSGYLKSQDVRIRRMKEIAEEVEFGDDVLTKRKLYEELAGHLSSIGMVAQGVAQGVREIVRDELAKEEW